MKRYGERESRFNDSTLETARIEATGEHESFIHRSDVPLQMRGVARHY